MKTKLLKIFLILTLIVSILSGCMLLEKDDSDGGDKSNSQNNENEGGSDNCTDKGDPETFELVIDDVTLELGATAQLDASVTIGGKVVPIEYEYAGSNILIENATVTALKYNTVTAVTARAGDHEAVFIVSVIGDKGTMTIEAPTSIYSNYAPKKINVTFSKPAFESEVTFTANDSRVLFKNGSIYATGSFSSPTSVKVTARSAYHTESFYVTVSTFNDHSAETKVQWYEENIIKEENKGGTIFIGDSYFDGKPNAEGTPPFWKDFYSDYTDGKTFLMGISSSQIYHWEIVSERIVYPMEPKEIILHIGFNDVHSSNRSANEIATRIIALLEEFREKLPNTKVYYCSIEPKKNALDSGTQFYERSMIYAPMINSMIEAYTQENTNVIFVDTRALFFNESGGIKKNYYLSTDLSHPTLEAYDEYRRAIEEARANEREKSEATVIETAALVDSAFDKERMLRIKKSHKA